MTTRSILRDSNLIFIDGNYPYRWLDGWGPGVCKFIEDFVQTPFASASNPACYTTTAVAGTNTAALTGGAEGGALLITTGGSDGNGLNIQALGEAFACASGKELYFGCKLQISSATESDFLVGLCITDGDVLGAVTDGVYFRKIDGTTTCNFVLEKASTETETAAATIAATTDYTLEFVFNGTNVDFWVNGVLGTRPVTTNLTAEYLTPTIAVLTGSDAAITCSVVWLRAIQVNTA